MRLDWRPNTIDRARLTDGYGNEDLVSGQAWSEFCDSLRRTGELVMRADLPSTPLDRATGHRHLMAMLQLGLTQALANPDPWYPDLSQKWRTNVIKFGHDCSDALYRSSAIDGELTYRVWGNVGSVHYLSFQTDGDGGTFSNLRGDEMDVDPDGSYELWVGPERQAGNWLPSAPDADLQLFVRQFFYNWDTEEAATMQIERVTQGDGPHGRDFNFPTPDRVARQLDEVARWFNTTMTYYTDREAHDRSVWPNGFMPSRTKTEDGAAAENILGHGHFDLGPDESLLVEVKPADAMYWSFQVTNPWREALDYANHHTSLNGHQAVLDEDGMFRAVIAHEDPGVPNWLDTLGHHSGAMAFRWIVSDSTPEPRCTVVPASEVRNHLPASTPTVSPAEREATIARRRAHVLRRFSA